MRDEYDAFWLRYLRAHAAPETRALHYAGSVAGVWRCSIAGVVRKDWRWLMAAPVMGYGFAWTAHVGDRAQPAGDVRSSALVAVQRYPHAGAGADRPARHRICSAPASLAGIPHHDATTGRTDRCGNRASAILIRPCRCWMPSFNKYRLPLASVERLATGCRWSEGPVYFGDGRYRAVERHPQRPHPEMGGRDRRGQRVPQDLQQRQRQHARPPGPAGHLRASRPAGDPHRVRRRHHRAGRQLSRARG